MHLLASTFRTFCTTCAKGADVPPAAGQLGRPADNAVLLACTCCCSVFLISLSDGTLVDPTTGFAGRPAASSTAHLSSGHSPRDRAGGSGVKPKHTPLTAFRIDAGGRLRCSSSCIRAVAWWAPRTLAVAEADGKVSLVRLPESVNILGAAPARFAAGRDHAAS